MQEEDNHHYIVSQNTLEIMFLFEVNNNPQNLCNKPTDVYPITYDSMYVAVHSGRFDMKTGRGFFEMGPHFYSIRILQSARNLENSMSTVLNRNQPSSTSIHG